MRSRRIYMLVVVLGLAMVWLGFLFVYELNIVQKKGALQEQHNSYAPGVHGPLQLTEPGSDDKLSEAGAGFPLVLAGVGVVMVLGGAARFRHRRRKPGLS